MQLATAKKQPPIQTQTNTWNSSTPRKDGIPNENVPKRDARILHSHQPALAALVFPQLTPESWASMRMLPSLTSQRSRLKKTNANPESSKGSQDIKSVLLPGVETYRI